MLLMNWIMNRKLPMKMKDISKQISSKEETLNLKFNKKKIFSIEFNNFLYLLVYNIYLKRILYIKILKYFN